MGTFIEDGKGAGNIAEVDNKQRLLVKSSSFVGEEVEAKEGNSFVLHGECHVAAATNGALFYFKNTSSTFNVFITRILIDGHSLTDDFIIRQVFDPTRSNGTSTTAVNKNRGSGKTLVGDFFISDGSSDMTFTGGTQYHAFPIKTLTTDVRDMQGSNILTPNTAVGFNWATVDGANAVNGEIISISMNIYLEEI